MATGTKLALLKNEFPSPSARSSPFDQLHTTNKARAYNNSSLPQNQLNGVILNKDQQTSEIFYKSHKYLKSYSVNPNNVAVNLPAGCKRMQLSPSFGKSFFVSPIKQIEMPIINQRMLNRKNIHVRKSAPWMDIKLDSQF